MTRILLLAAAAAVALLLGVGAWWFSAAGETADQAVAPTSTGRNDDANRSPDEPIAAPDQDDGEVATPTDAVPLPEFAGLT